jgi:hypothetical protein
MSLDLCGSSVLPHLISKDFWVKSAWDSIVESSIRKVLHAAVSTYEKRSNGCESCKYKLREARTGHSPYIRETSQHSDKNTLTLPGQYVLVALLPNYSNMRRFNIITAYSVTLRCYINC